jgi:hypothetical protein
MKLLAGKQYHRKTSSPPQLWTMGNSGTGLSRAKGATHRSGLGRNGQFGNLIPVREAVASTKMGGLSESRNH